MTAYKVYYINLDKSIARKEFMEMQFKNFKIPITRFPAVYGKKLNKNYLKKAKRNHNILTHFLYLNDGEIGLTKTYFKLWKTIANAKEDFAIVLEDDALLSSTFFNDLEHLLKQINNKDFVDISGREGFISLEKNAFFNTFLVPSLQTTGQIIGKNAAKNLSENLTSYYAPIDVMKQDIYKHKVKVLTTVKKYVVSNDKNIEGGSTIQQKSMPAFKKVIREIIRPFWQLITLLSFKPYRLLRNYLFYKS